MRYLTTDDGTRIAYDDQGRTDSPNPPVLLLHGLAGHLGEWDDLTPRLLSTGHRVIRYDARGHGASTRRPGDMTRAAAVADAAALLTHLGAAPATLIGQSLGGLTALLLAARHPRLVSHLILMEAGPAGPTPSLPTDIAKWLATWPTPFRSFEEAKTFLGHEAWARGLQKRENGYHPRFDPAAMTEAVSELATENYWSDWSRITCPTLVLRGERGTMPAEEAKEMQTRRPDTKVEVITGAGHDVHLERLTQAYQAITAFLREDKYPPLWTRSGPRRGA
ncbi:alpha/beta fold hydrolase [Streptomyces sp. Ru71]|uniref:alpha/beta fold hydrolase n=1 Tax=Streptomyces sp. Ru71 TaxID=2080746 RepID=UPI00215621C9|nr:alpha/beta hydrolase [Streptomyces sp. Ru71]